MKEPEDMPLFGAEGLRQLERVNEEIARKRQGRPEASAGPAPVHDEPTPTSTEEGGSRPAFR